VLAGLSIAAGIPAGAESPPPSTSPSLAITVDGLEAGIGAALDVTGPDGYEEPVTSTMTLPHLTPGRYTVKAHPVKDAEGTYWPVPNDGPDTWHTSVEVSAQGPAAVTVTYSDFVSNRVRVVPLGATESLVIGDSTDQLDVLRQVAAQTYREGEILVSEPTPVAPDGYLVQVSKVEASPDSSLEALEVHPVPLEDAIPEADIDESTTLSAYGPKFESKELSCATGGTVTLSSQLHITPTVTLKAKWGRRSHRSAELVAALNEDASSEIVSKAHVDCHLRSVDLGPSLQLAPHGIVFFIGPVPVVVTASLGVAAEGRVTSTASFSAYVEQRAELGMRLYYPQVDGNWATETSKHFKVPDGAVTAGIHGNARVALVPELRVRLYGLVGPTAGVRLSAELEVSPEKRTLSVCAQMQGHLHLPRFKNIPAWKSKYPYCGTVLKWLSN
jgi:hypothetical protein